MSWERVALTDLFDATGVYRTPTRTYCYPSTDPTCHTQTPPLSLRTTCYTLSQMRPGLHFGSRRPNDSNKIHSTKLAYASSHHHSRQVASVRPREVMTDVRWCTDGLVPRAKAQHSRPPDFDLLFQHLVEPPDDNHFRPTAHPGRCAEMYGIIAVPGHRAAVSATWGTWYLSVRR